VSRTIEELQGVNGPASGMLRRQAGASDRPCPSTPVWAMDACSDTVLARPCKIRSKKLRCTFSSGPPRAHRQIRALGKPCCPWDWDERRSRFVASTRSPRPVVTPSSR
jgi:hypothetical protein